MDKIKLTPRTALIMIDWQKGFDDLAYWGGPRNNPQAEANALALLELWRKAAWPIIHVQHASSNPKSIFADTSPGFDLKEELLPLAGEPLLRKSVNSAFIGTDLKERLDAAQIDTVVITGLTTDHCVSTTTRMAANLGYRTILVSDATAAFSKTGIEGERYSADTIHLTALAHLKDEFATIKATTAVAEMVEAAVGRLQPG